MSPLAALLAGLPSNLTLDEAALLLARIEHPGLDPEPHIRTLDSYAVELAGRLSNPTGPAFVAETNRFLFGELGFTGNIDDYYNPANSCLNEVLETRTGLPITLSVIYLEVARRLAKPVFGVAAPGHFIVQYDDGLYATGIDPFHEGKLVAAPASPRAGTREIIGRMINNLRGVYYSRGSYRKLIQLLDLVIEADPRAGEEFKLRGAAHLRLDNPRAAKADFERYLALEPEAGDREEIERRTAALRKWLIGMN
jgi:regulator of sirC expression with transglutaminase-like and TPR domain